MEPLLEVRHLTIAYEEAQKEVVRDCSLSLSEREILGIVGESGSGKTTLVMSILGFLKEGAVIREGEIRYGGKNITPPLAERERRKIRGGEIAVVMQNAMSSLDPLMKVGGQIMESLRIHGGCTKKEAKERAEELLDMVGIRDVKGCMNKYPFECSGGMQQRICIAIALAGNPRILIADEPTTALDVTVQAQILNLLRRLCRDLGIAMILISHDLGVVKMLCSRIMIMHEGKMIEQGRTEDILRGGREPYTRALIQARRNLEQLPFCAQETEMKPVLINMSRVSKKFQKKEILHSISLTICKHQTYGLVGESGCGKSTLACTMLGIYRPDAGSICWEEERIDRLSGKKHRFYGRKMQMIFQNPYQALNPSMTVYENLREALIAKEIADETRIRDEISAMLAEVGIEEHRLCDLPGQLSGGQLQRIMIARALLMSPELLVCDEPFTGLDIQVQEQLVHLLSEMKEKEHLSMLVISHDLSLMSRISDVLGVVYAGWMLEEGPCRSLVEESWHPYTKALFLAGEKVKLTAGGKKKMLVQEEAVSIQKTAGCPYADNCKYAQKRCFVEVPELYEYGKRKVRCFLYAEEMNAVREEGYHMRSLI
ncbi:ABC transporter ATP-binding protein [Dorea sp. OM02-2LB]|nr:ABC transporter ATP-binding protein [Dorea sp. OM02-2LB]